MKWTYSYIDHLQDFVKTINRRTNRVTNLAPIKVTEKEVPRLVSLTVTTKSEPKTPKFKPGDFVRIAKKDLPFRKGYKQTYTNQLFEFQKLATFNPPTCNLIETNREEIKGKFYHRS